MAEGVQGGETAEVESALGLSGSKRQLKRAAKQFAVAGPPPAIRPDTVSPVTLDGVISRDGASCLWCGRASWPGDLTLEHLLPKTRGGRGIPENVVVACCRCNRRRGAKPVVAYVRGRLAAGELPDIERLRNSLERLSCSESTPHARYGRRQLALLGRIGEPGSSEHGRLAREPSRVELG